MTIPDYVAIGLLAVCLMLWGGTALLKHAVTLLGMPFSPHQIAVIGARLIARCVCFQPMGDLMRGSHSHD